MKYLLLLFIICFFITISSKKCSTCNLEDHEININYNYTKKN